MDGIGQMLTETSCDLCCQVVDSLDWRSVNLELCSDDDSPGNLHGQDVFSWCSDEGEVCEVEDAFEGFCKEVRFLFGGGNVAGEDGTREDLVVDEVMGEVDVF
jgi:hypothetical protein